MKIAAIGPATPVLNSTPLGGAGGSLDPIVGSGLVPTASGSNTWSWGSNVARITAEGSNVLGPFVNFAAGSNIILTLDAGPAGALSSNTLRIHSTSGAGSIGPAGVIGPRGLDGDDGQDSLIPGPPGTTGAAGTPGTPGAPGIAGGIGPPGLDGDEGDDSFVPGPPGPPGATGPPGPRALDGDEGELGQPGSPSQSARWLEDQDVRIARRVAGTVRFDTVSSSANSVFEINATAGTRAILDFSIAGEANARARVSGDATAAGLELGTGAAVLDVSLKRSAVGQIDVGSLGAAGATVIRTVSTAGQRSAVAAEVAGDTVDRIAMFGDATVTGIEFGSGAATRDVRFRRSAAKTVILDDNAATASAVTLNLLGLLQVNSTQVVSTRKTGWTVATGTASRATYVTSSVTLATLAGVVMALEQDLISHGLIG